MREKSWGLIGGTAAAMAALAAITFGAAGGFAGDDLPGAGNVVGAGELETVKAEVVESPSTAAGVPGTAARPAAKPKKPKMPQLLYLETEPQTLGPGPVGFKVGSCPGKAKAINGYYFINGTETGFGLTAQGDSPIQGLRQWAFYLDGGVAGASNVTFGLVCLKNVK